MSDAREIRVPFPGCTKSYHFKKFKRSKINSKGQRQIYFQAHFLVADDIMDGSITRRGQPCWYKKDNIGMMAVNDALILESCIYELLDKHLKGDPYYHDAVDAFHKVG